MEPIGLCGTVMVMVGCVSRRGELVSVDERKLRAVKKGVGGGKREEEAVEGMERTKMQVEFSSVVSDEDQARVMNGLHGLSEMLGTWADLMEQNDVSAWVLYGRLSLEIEVLDQMLDEFLVRKAVEAGERERGV